jgi:ribosome modulation factor
MSLRWLFIFPRHEKSRQSVWFCSYFLGGWEGRQDHGVIEPVTLCFFLPSSYHSLCSLPPEFGSKAKQFPEIWIGCSKHKNRRSDFCVGYCTSQSTSPLQNPTYQNGKGGESSLIELCPWRLPGQRIRVRRLQKPATSYSNYESLDDKPIKKWNKLIFNVDRNAVWKDK